MCLPCLNGQAARPCRRKEATYRRGGPNCVDDFSRLVDMLRYPLVFVSGSLPETLPSCARWIAVVLSKAC